MYIVTGATGFIGSNLLAEMQKRGYRDIVAVDTFGDGDKWKNIAKRRALQLLFPHQLQDFLLEHKDEINAVVHLGAISSTTETDVDKIVENNFQLTVRLFTFCRHNAIPLVYASSAATYGAGELGFVDRDDITFLSSLRPLNPYGWSKNAVDKYISSTLQDASTPTFSHSNNPQVVGLKFFNVYGPNEYHKGMQMSVMRHFCEQFRNTGKVRLFKSYRDDCADGEQRRDFVWVGDCVRVMLWMLEHGEVSGLFNVGTGSATSYNVVARSVARALGVDPVIEYIDMPDSVRNQYQYFTQADLTKLRSVGYDAPFTSVPDGVDKYVRGFLATDDIYL
jgi:ADP-L-glycero-D-manno-heptose 6-epimerase